MRFGTTMTLPDRLAQHHEYLRIFTKYFADFLGHIIEIVAQDTCDNRIIMRKA